jgi:Tfp pilus assembly protein PilP
VKKYFLILVLMVLNVSSGEIQDEKSVIYSPVGKRDPFKAPIPRSLSRDLAAVNPLEKYNLEQLQLRAILKGIGKHRVMFEDPEGKTHILTEGSLLGREKATVSRILDREVILTVRTFNYLGAESLSEKVIYLPSDEEETIVKEVAPAATIRKKGQ